MELLPQEPWMYSTQETCRQFLEGIDRYMGGEGWCSGTTDGDLCWPTAAAGDTISQLCPIMQGVDPTKYARKTCGWDGEWAGKDNVKGSHGAFGYTDYDPCLTDDAKHLLETYYVNGSDVEAQFAVLIRSRTIEIYGFPLSLICVLISLFIFRYFRILRSARTTIHVHLFSAIVVMTLCKTVEISDQFLSGMLDADSPVKATPLPVATVSNATGTAWSLRELRPLCEMLVTLIEFGRTAMFFWMFLEGLYMHNVVAWKVFEASKPNFRVYCAVGWGIPALLVGIWAPLIEFVWWRRRFLAGKVTSEEKCWFLYSRTSYYYILEMPRLFVIGINLLFLVNIIRVLLTKLRESRESDTVQIRKAIKATIVLAPLLGITHLIWAYPLENVPVNFRAPFLYISHFLRAFEGFFVALVYCFLNGEVQNAIRTAVQRSILRRTAGRSANNRKVSQSASSPFLVRAAHNKNPPTGSEGAKTNGSSSMFQLLPKRDKYSKNSDDHHLSVTSLSDSSRQNLSPRLPRNGLLRPDADTDV